MKVRHASPVPTEQVTGLLLQLNERPLPKTSLITHTVLSSGEREAIQKSVTRSCLLEESSAGEELSDSGGEEAAEAME